jgi:hypothetical protein
VLCYTFRHGHCRNSSPRRGRDRAHSRRKATGGTDGHSDWSSSPPRAVALG